ncbi:MAG: sodium:proton antiporter, partial [Clostridiales bacterium]|nr:sodium:proton antiporter [Clostridiales bacterium]
AVTVLLLGEGYLADIALIYAMLSFLAVILLSKVYTGIYEEHKHEESLLAGKNGKKEGGV